jgi:acetylornithine/LysW-gamma-L-lysine aminotransferase
MDAKYETGVYAKKAVALVRGKGSKLWDAEGNEYLDMGGGNYGVCNVGHCTDDVIHAVKEQSERLIYSQSTFPNDVRSELMERLIELVPKPLSHVYLCNSGTEAIEAAIKFARGSTGKKEFIAANHAFHGRTMGALSATWKPDYREPFAPLVPGFSHVPYGDAAAIEKAITDNTAAVMLEPVQGEGGVNVPPPGYLKQVSELCSRRGVLLIVDEIQTGFCRTGRMFAFEHSGIVPDILCVGKSIAGGLPMGATFMTDSARGIPKGSHGTTFGGNPVVCAAALASIRYMREHRLAERAAELGDYLVQSIRNLNSPKIRDVRGVGLMVGVEFKTRSAAYLIELLKRRVLALQAGTTVIRFLPPLVVEREELDFAIRTLSDVLRGEVVPNG